ncbi:glycosyltransferase family 2 protein [Flavobacterium agricola]|uniref:Glycosyltransferase family 2 protein n=1 Tax=Flavobacterium agricola TaxID=2870839 RepID=A0ABY6M1M7_9FLAO|nr:glycosyltransferase family 2 protein [Flavobacterium agricola]UYW02341.1 glycosyltransferase family 2 protein [Flavobacterium agricola]
MKQLALVILNWNGKNLLEQFLPSVVKYSQQAQIYVADNASTDNSVAFLQQHYPEIIIIQNDKNYGYAAGYNLALKKVEEPILCLLNSDIEVTENWLTPILNVFSEKQNVAIVQPQIADYKNKKLYEYAGAAGGFIDKYGFAYCRGRIFETLEAKNTYGSAPIFWASGACFFIKKDVFNSLQGFDTDFFAHQEEIDLCWRAYNANYQAYYCAESTVYHLGGATLQHSNPKKTFLNFRNSLCMLAKNLPKNKLFAIIFLRLCLDGLAGVRLFFKGQFAHVWAIITSHFAFYRMLSKMLKKRNGTHKESYYGSKSIIWAYFIKNITHFSNI